MKFGICLLIFTISLKSFSNDSILIPQLFQNLLNKQNLETDFFVQGSFSSFRQQGDRKKIKADNNIFFTALVAYTLNELKPLLNTTEKIVADTIINRAKKAYSFYQNSKHKLTYNFWPTTESGNFFPNNKFLSSRSKSLALPDDLDDTGIILAASNLPDSVAKKAHLIMQNFINGKNKTITNTYKKYKNTPAYSTWYGVKMPIDFDFGVHCNILSFVNKYNLNWTISDSSTYHLLLAMIDEEHYLKTPNYISPYYSTASVLLYHIARLSSSKKLTELENRKELFIKNGNELFNQEKNILNKILIASSLYKWNAKPTNIEITKEMVEGSLNTTDFVYYNGHLFAHLNNFIKNITSKLNATHFKWYSSAFNDCLILEYLILKHRKKTVDAN